jgi:hypothetical protein
MAFWKQTNGKNYRVLDTFSSSRGSDPTLSEFYEFEPAVVLDVVLDEKHEIFKNKNITSVDSDRWPSDVSNKKPLPTDVDYTWIGRALVRLTESQKTVEKENLTWAYPLESNISEYPLINEIVIVVKHFGQTFYTRKLNCVNTIHSNEKFATEMLLGGFTDGTTQRGNRELNKPNTEFQGPKSVSRHNGGYGFEGVAGRYFWINKNIRSIRRHEGDFVLESRFGQSLRFSAYDDNRNNDKSDSSLKDYRSDGTDNPVSKVKAGGGNPMIVLRNRQRPILKVGEQYRVHDKLPMVVGTELEKNVGGIIDEDINNDGSTIAITSGATISKWNTSCYKQMWAENKEEQRAFSPPGCSLFTHPILNNDQIVINTDRIILSSRLAETFHFSKKRYAIVTDSEFTVDSHDQTVLTSNVKTVINSPAIYLGEYDVTSEPALLGQTTINWLYELCNWLLSHTHWYKHSHVDAGEESPSSTQLSVERKALIALRDRLETLMSRRVFVTGGGFATGQNGESIKDGVPPTKIDVKSGSGVPGKFNGQNFRTI